MKLLVLLSLTLTSAFAMASTPFYFQSYCQNDSNTIMKANGSVEGYFKVSMNGNAPEGIDFDTDLRLINEVLSENEMIDCAEGIKVRTTNSSMKFELKRMDGAIMAFSTLGLSADGTMIKGIMNCTYVEKTYHSCR